MKNYFSLIGLLVFTAIIIEIDLSSLIKILSKSNILFLFFSFLLNFLVLFIKSFRWRYILKNQDIFISQLEAYSIYSASAYFGIITPGRIGDFLRVFYLKKNYNIDIIRGLPSIIFDRIQDIYFLLFLFSVGIWKYNILGWFTNYFYVIILFIVFLPLNLFNENFSKKIILFILKAFTVKKYKSKIINNFDVFYDELEKAVNKKVFLIIGLTIFSHFIVFTQCYFITQALQIKIDYFTVILFYSITSIISFLPISISGIGTRDAALVYLFYLVGIQPELAVSFSLLIFIIIYLGVGLIGLVSSYNRPIKLDFKSF